MNLDSAPSQFTESRLTEFRPVLTRHCYQMLGSLSDAEDAAQTALMRAWRARDQFRADSTLETWVYRIATNVCLDLLKHSSRRVRPMEEVTMGHLDGPLDARDSAHWLEPFPTSPARLADVDPASAMITRERMTLAVVAALQNLPPRQRAALLLAEVVELTAAEVADCLDCSVAAANSALQRARSNVSKSDMRASTDVTESDAAYAARFVAALEAYDMEAIAELMHEDVILSMPPYELWLRGVSNLVAWFSGRGIGCAGSRFVPTHANGDVAFGQYRKSPDGGHRAWALIVLERKQGLITGYNAFLETERLFPSFGLPLEL